MTVPAWIVLAVCAPAALVGIVVLRRRARRARTAHIPRPRPTQAAWNADARIMLRRLDTHPLAPEPPISRTTRRAPTTGGTMQHQPCPHCPDGHRPPASGTWHAHVDPDRDGDGQPIRITVARPAGAHVADSDAEWISRRLNSHVTATDDPRSPALAAFIAYGLETGGLTHDGQPIPDWDGLGPRIQRAWAAAAQAALDTAPDARTGDQAEAARPRVKPALPARAFGPWPRIPVDTGEGTDAARLLRLAHSAATDWAISDTGVYKDPTLTMAAIVDHVLREGLLHLLELGLIDIDTDRMRAAKGIPLRRSDLLPANPDELWP
ncbi:hypothetical protein [Kitasatospora sp. NPDC057500]|uniref:hypothetical protein n=1 Tax=Kitasatospora sp. NPDC057500 TaxID=3346151 RepID=UPI0036983145